MRKIYFIPVLFAFIFNANTGFCTKHTISATNVEYAFSPGDVSAYVGDTIVFALGSYHSALEVSQSTWNADGNTALSGGFHVTFGGGEIVVALAKTYYYVCENHYFMGMKGTINVTNPTGVRAFTSTAAHLDVFPNPVSSKVEIKANLPEGKGAEVKIFDATGKCLFSKENASSDQYLDLSEFSQGAYFVAIRFDDVFMERKIIVSR